MIDLKSHSINRRFLVHFIVVLQIISPLESFNCFVYVRGLRAISDLLLKWCCEYTERCPWRFIYFENTDSTFNFAENRDRCNYSFFDQLSLPELCSPSGGHHLELFDVQYKYPASIAMESSLEKFAKILEPGEGWGNLTEAPAKSQWEQLVRDNLAHKHVTMLIISPPGAGTTNKD
jgi:hypothetical protein